MKTALMASVLVAAILLPCVLISAQDATNRDGSAPEVRESRSLEDWISLAKSGTSDLRLEAAKELGCFGLDAKKAVPVLVGLLDDGFWATRMEAALSLGKIGPGAKAAVPRLAKSITDCDASVREAAYIALRTNGRRCATRHAGLDEAA